MLYDCGVRSEGRVRPLTSGMRTPYLAVILGILLYSAVSWSGRNYLKRYTKGSSLTNMPVKLVINSMAVYTVGCLLPLILHQNLGEAEIRRES